MRKQTKLAVVLSAAALLAIGASMTSFAKGWEQEDGEWVYLDSEGDRTYDAWKKSGNNYYYLNEDGVMATSTVIEYDGNKYYVDETGKKVTNQWVSVDNEDNEEIGGYDDIDVIWYYFGSTGKAHKDAVKTVSYAGGSAKFAFDENGYMLSGWQWLGDDADELYYFGTQDEGWAHTGWQYLEPKDDPSDAYDDEEWFYFKPSTGKAYVGARKYINGKYYTFDDEGVMDDKWVTGTPGAPASGSSARYDADNGNQATGWVYTYAVDDPDEEGDEYWFYLNSKGVPFNLNGEGAVTEENAEPAAQTIQKKNNEKWDNKTSVFAAKVIKSKTYLFNAKGEMQTGVFKLAAGQTIVRVGSSSDLGDASEATVYYFDKTSGSGQGAMVTGKTTVTYDGDVYTYYFQKDGKAYANYIADGTYYDEDGERVDAEDGNTYDLIEVEDVQVKGDDDAEVTGTIVVNSNGKVKSNRQIITRSNIKLPQPFASWSNSL